MFGVGDSRDHFFKVSSQRKKCLILIKIALFLKISQFQEGAFAFMYVRRLKKKIKESHEPLNLKSLLQKINRLFPLYDSKQLPMRETPRMSITHILKLL